MAPLDDTTSEAGNLRIIAALQSEVDKLKGTAPTRLSEARGQVHMGRCIRRLVSLYDPLTALVAENDRRSILEQTDVEDESTDESQLISSLSWQDRLYRAFKELVHYVPFVRTVLEDCDLDKQRFVLRNLRQGSDGARADDTGNLKSAVVRWAAEIFGSTDGSQPALEPTIKYDRGFVHDGTGHLLCPIEFDWSQAEVRKNIRDGHADFTVTAKSWPTFLYENFTSDSNNLEKGLFKSSLLLKAFRHIFTSPSSSSKGDPENDDPQIDGSRLTKKRRVDVSTRANVATLCNLKSVTPRSIAYIAVQLRFALSSSGSWTEREDDFDYADFYNSVIGYFETVPGPVAKAHVDELLKWWNRKIFGRIPQSGNRATSVSTSISRMAQQRAGRELAIHNA